MKWCAVFYVFDWMTCMAKLKCWPEEDEARLSKPSCHPSKHDIKPGASACFNAMLYSKALYWYDSIYN